MQEITSNKDGLRSLSQLFSARFLKLAIQNSSNNKITHRILKHSSFNTELTLLSVFKELYSHLFENYRSEYFYKNTILNEIILKEYSLSSTTVLNEFRIGGSLADIVLLNGEIQVFEVKTDLDDLSKLDKQLDDYSKFADKIYVVCGEKLKTPIKKLVKNTGVGIIQITDSGLRLVKEPQKLKSQNHETIFKTLRKPEYLKLIENEYGCVPDLPNTKIFKACLELSSSIEIGRFKLLAMNQLKDRKPKNPEVIMDRQTPYELRYLYFSMNLEFDEYEELYEFLNQRLCTSHI